MVRSRQTESCWICGEENARIESAWKEKKRETEEEVDGCDKGRFGEGWCWGRRGGRQKGLEGEDALWRP